MYNSKLKSLYSAFLHSIKLSEYRMGIKFDKNLLAVDQNNCLSKVVKVYIVYNLDAWPRNPANNFKFKNYLFGVTSILKNSGRGKYEYSGYGITFDSGGSWSFDNTARNVIIVAVDNSSSTHFDNRKNNFLGPTFGINESFGSPEKKFSINFRKARTKFCLSLHFNADNTFLFVNRKETFKFKAGNKNGNFPTQFCLESISNGM